MDSFDRRSWDFSRRGRARVILITLVGTFGSMAVAAATVAYTTQFMPENARLLTWAAALILPLLISVPTFYFFSEKLRELAIAHHQLTIFASQDSLTSCLNRGAFVTLVDAYLSQVKANAPAYGALLVIDADHFKTINDRFGHANGDEALRLMARLMKSSLRGDDLLGRVGGEEFAVFLPYTSEKEAELVAERIRHAIYNAKFTPDGIPQPMSVSVGGVAFLGSIPFDQLFAVADARLYEAKQRGRNRVEFADLYRFASTPSVLAH